MDYGTRRDICQRMDRYRHRVVKAVHSKSGENNQKKSVRIFLPRLWGAFFVYSFNIFGSSHHPPEFMPLISATGKNRRKVRFPSNPPSLASSSKRPGIRVKMSQEARPGIPVLFTQPPPIRDPLVTETIDLQDATLEKILPLLKGLQSSAPLNAHGVPALRRDDHLAYLYDALEDYPPGFVAMDSSRPWMVYWALAGLSLLGEDVTRFQERLVIARCLFPIVYVFNCIVVQLIVLSCFCFSNSFLFPFSFLSAWDGYHRHESKTN